MIPSFANSPKNSSAASQYAACASSRVSYVPKLFRFPFIPIRACHPLPLRFTPLNPLRLRVFLRRFCIFWLRVAGRRFDLLLSRPLPFKWSIWGDTVSIKNRWRYVIFPFTLARAYQLHPPIWATQVYALTHSISSASIIAQNPWVSSKYAIEGPMTGTGVLDDERL